MNKTTLLLIASLAVLTSGASAAQSQPEPELLVLPTYVVNAPRYLPTQLAVNASLNELRQQAKTPMVVQVEFPALKAKAAHGAVARAAHDVRAGRLAKS